MSQRTILTGADQLIALVREHNVISVGNAARKLDSDPERVRLLAESLEEQGSIVLYQAIRDVLIVDRDHYVAMNGSIGLMRPFLASLFSPRSRTKSVDIQERDRALDTLSKTLSKRSRSLDVRSVELEKLAADIASRESALELREQGIAERERALTDRERILARYSASVEKKVREAEVRESKIAAMLDRARSLLR